jgi:adenine-specific DNA-methyltransferase
VERASYDACEGPGALKEASRDGPLHLWEEAQWKLKMKNQIVNDLMPATPDLNAERLAKLKELFPDLFTEAGTLNPDELKALVDPEGTAGRERYEFNWNGKRESKRKAFTPATATLIYDGERSVNPEAADGNLIIEGENLETLKCLLAAYREKIKCIYIDPPYNTGKDFVYSDNYTADRKAYWESTNTEQGVNIDTNADSSGRFHSDWLSMIHPRLLLARQLLRPDGVIFISIDDNEVSNLRKLCDEVFGEESLLGTVIWKNATDNNPTNVAVEHEYIHVYCKSRESVENEWKSSISDVKDRLVEVGKELVEANENPDVLQETYTKWYREHKNELWPLDRYKYIDKGGVYTGSQSVHNPGREGYRYDVLHPETGRPCKQPMMGYRFPEETMKELLDAKKILFGDDENKIIELKVYAHEYQEKLASVLELDGRLGAYDLRALFPELKKTFTNPKPVRLLESFLPFLLKNPNDMVLDFFSGSGSTGHAIMDLNAKDGDNRRFILVQLPEQVDEKSEAFKAGYKKISDITIERNRRVIERMTAEAEKDPGLFDGDFKAPGFKVYRLAKSTFPRVDFTPDPEKSEEENVEALKRYIDEKERVLFADYAPSVVMDEVLLKNGFMLNYTLEKQEAFKENAVYLAADGEQSALICLDDRLHESTIAQLSDHWKFICLERALDTTKKWNLRNQLKENFIAF